LTTPRLAPIAELGRLSQADFAAAVRPLFEAADPLTRALYAARPFASYSELIDTAEALAQAMPFAEQAAVLSAHPRIGADPTTLSAASYAEQGYSRGTETLTAVNEELAELNRQYEQRFGFRFVVFVNKRPRSEILMVLKHRLQNERHDELRTGLRDMFLIARDRLSSLDAR
jgi:2-oxo-4-hydroxy-4-carboxy-5-ureidoimidazoline decarboxylase